MNANELADWLEYKSALTEYSCVKEAAKQLRQQQAEIEALKGVVQTYKEIMVTLENKLRKELDGKEKELTEDEIREVADSVCHAWKKNGVGELYMEDFARAILRKAQEK
jgi:hypothetical protein